MSALTPINDAGVRASINESGGLRLRGLSKLTAEQKARIIKYARAHKQPIIAALAQSGDPGQCESCPAAGHWDYIHYANQGLMCFHYAYYLGKSGKPQPCSVVRVDCPRDHNDAGVLTGRTE